MTFNIHSHPLLSALNFLATLNFLILFCSFKGTIRGYTITYDLISHDSPLSPFYDPSSTQFDRLYDAFKRSIERVKHLKSRINIPMHPGIGEYIMKMSLGTPPNTIVGVLDTGSDLTWTKCLPCIQCYNDTIPPFDPTHSSSYKTITCGSRVCQKYTLNPSCKDQTLPCKFYIIYEDGTYSVGNLASETLTLGNGNNSISVPNFLFGCGHNNSDKSGIGVIGLGSSNISLISQLSPSIGKKFSYCLVPTSVNSPSKISFGNDAVVSGPTTVTTPIQKNHGSSYYLLLEGISVGTQRISIPKLVDGNTCIDSGTTMTFLRHDIFNPLMSALDKVIKLQKVEDPNKSFGACYQIGGGDKNKIKLPNITFHFKGADVELQPVQTFVWVKPNVVCLSILGDEESILGNIAQTNFEIGYDLEAGIVSFRPTDCAKQH